MSARLETAILVELEYSNLDARALARRVDGTVTEVKTALRQLEERGKVKEVGEENIWSLT